MRKRAANALILLIIICLVMSLGGCGSGGSSDPPPASPSGGGGGGSSSSTTVSGSVVDGFISNAAIQAYQINANGTKGATIGSATTSDSTGAYSLNLGSYSGPALIESSGGSFKDWATGTTITLASTDVMRSVISNATSTSATTAHITSLTYMATQRALRDMSLNGTAATTAVNNANSQVAQYFGSFNILTDKPIDPTVAGSAGGVSQNRVDYGMVLAGISQNAAANAWKPFSLVTAMANDASDGTHDGKQGTTQLTVTTNAGATANLPATAGKSDLGSKIDAFQNSAQNKSTGTTTPAIITNLNSTSGTFSSQPDPPTGLTATTVSPTQINLSWSASAGATGYNIYRGGTLLKSVTTLTSSDAGLTANTQYCYTVTATDNAGNESNKSAQVCATTNVAPPSVPTGLTATGASQSQVDLAWSAGAGAAPAGYKIYKAGVLLKSVTTTTSSDTGLAASTQYCYTVSSYDSAGNESAQTTQVCATTQPSPPPTPPPVPTGLTATAASQSQVNLSWNASSGAASYRVYRGGVYINNTTSTSLSDTGLTANTQYCYTVSAVDSSGNASAQSSQICATTLTVPPSVPTGLTTTTASTSQINLTWTASAGATGYKIYRSGTLLKSVTTTNTSDTGLKSGTQYCYQVTAYDATGSESAQSTQSCATTTTVPTPTNLTATAASSTQINLSWTASAGASGYKIYKGGSYLKSVGGTTASDTGLTASTQYCYTVSAYDATGNESAQTSQMCAMTLNPPPATPTDFTVSAASTTQVNLSWTAATGAASYNIYRNGTLLKNVTTTSTTDTGLTANTKYCYTVSALDATSSESAQSSPSQCVTTPAIEAPTNLAAAAVSASQINLTWTAPVGGAAGYNIYKKTGAGGTKTLLRSVTITSTSDTGLAANTQYCYIATAYDGAGKESVDTTQVCATTNLASPGTPTGLTATTVSQTQINLTWTALAGTPAAVGYKIYKDGVYLRSVTTTSASDTGLTANTRYCYTVSAYDSGGNDSSQTASVCATTNVAGPATPTGVTVTPISSSQLNVSWTAVAGVAGYKIYKGGAYYKSVPSAQTAYSDTGLSANTQFCYAVTANDSDGNDSGTSSTVCATTLNTPPPVPAGLSGTAISPTQIDLTWSAATGAASYKIYRNGTALPTVTATSFSDTGRTANTQYCYTIASLDSTGSESAQSSQTCVTTPAIAAATGLTVTAISSTQINLSWTAPAGAVQYKIYRGGTLLKSVTGVSSSDTGLTASTQYCYTIYAFDGSGNSSLQSSQVCATTFNPPPAAPTGLTASAVSTASITLTWTAVTGAASYKIYKDGVFLVEKASPTVNHTDTGLAASTKYCYTVTALDSTGSESAQSSQACGNTGLLIPTGLTATAASTSQINLSWTAATGASTYKIYRDGALLKAVTGVAGTNTTSDASLTANTLYCYSVSSVDSVGNESAQSSKVCVTTNLSPPPPPTGLTATAVLNSQVDLTWTASAGATGYKIYRDGVYLKTVTTTSMSDLGLTAYTKYCYTVAAVKDNCGDSPQSAGACAITDVAGPATPAGFTVEPLNSTSIKLSWTVPVTAVRKYEVYQNGAFLTSVNAYPTDPGTFTVTGLTHNTQYCYRISAVDASGKESVLTSQLCATTYNTPPADPVSPAAAAVTTSQITLSWTASTGAAQYKIYRNGVLLGSSTTASYTDNTVAATTNYCYQITAVDASGSESGKSIQVCADTGLTVPGGVTAEVVSSTQINLSWNAATGATGGYKVYKNGALLGSVNTTSLVDAGLTANTQYCYSVSSVRQAGGAESAKSSQICVTTTSPPTPATVDLLVSSQQLNSDGASTVSLTALVKDSGNRALSNQTVSFSGDSGIVTVTSGTTDASGKATATLGTGGNKKNRTINLTAASGAISSTNTVNVVGTTVKIQGATTLAMGGKTTLTIFLRDSADAGISGKSVALSSVKGNTFSVNPVITDTNGQATVEVTAAVAGDDTITATCADMNASGTSSLTVSATTFSFLAPTASQEVNIGVNQNVQVNYRKGAAPYNGKTVNFTTTRGTLSSATAVTDVNGDTNVITISSTTAGSAVITASVTGDTSIQQNIEFVAITAAEMTLQANPTTIGPNTPPSTTEKSTITAVIYDPTRNLVKNKTIDFELTDVTGGTISPASAVTDSQGKASTVYTSSATDSAVDGITVKATVRGTAAVTKDVRLTVAKKAKYISLGTSKTSLAGSGTYYQKSYIVLVTDATGNPVSNATVNLSVVPINFDKGHWSDNGTDWAQTVTKSCENEDRMWCTYTSGSLIIPGGVHPSWCLNGIIDVGPPTEDVNSNSRLDPGGIATVPASVTTDANGTSEFKITYAKSYSPWVFVQLQARTATSGSDAVAIAEFTLPYLGTDYPYATMPPPNSPFGDSAVCTDTN